MGFVVDASQSLWLEFGGQPSVFGCHKTLIFWQLPPLILAEARLGVVDQRQSPQVCEQVLAPVGISGVD